MFACEHEPGWLMHARHSAILASAILFCLKGLQKTGCLCAGAYTDVLKAPAFVAALLAMTN
jgi:hypothetical protein